MKDKAGGATERARGDRFGTNGTPRQSGGVPPECRDGKKCLQSNLRYATLFDAKYERKELLKCTFCTTTR